LVLRFRSTNLVLLANHQDHHAAGHHAESFRQSPLIDRGRLGDEVMVILLPFEGAAQSFILNPTFYDSLLDRATNAMSAAGREERQHGI
jgi:hypothetical protein